ncbi:MAG: twin-arginine translocase TatA/TatE family subunit [Desertimonas sp.]
MGAPELGIIAVIVLLIFGGSQLPKLARNLGQAQKEFKDGLAQGEADAAKKSATETTATESRATDNTSSGNTSSGSSTDVPPASPG